MSEEFKHWEAFKASHYLPELRAKIAELAKGIQCRPRVDEILTLKREAYNRFIKEAGIFDLDMVSNAQIIDMWVESWVHDMPTEQATLWAIFPKLEKPNLAQLKMYCERNNMSEAFEGLAKDWNG